MDSKWFVPIGPQNHGRPLFCLPYAGGGSTLFRGWGERLSFDTVAVELPGRCRRFGEPSARSMDAIVEPLLEALRPHVERPFALFGHSLGGLIAFELAHRCHDRFGREPDHVVIAAIPPPPHEPPPPVPRQGGEAALARRLRFAGGTPPDALANEELMRILAPRLDADFEVVDTYRPQRERKLACPLTVVGGDADPVAPPDSLNAWRDETSGPFRRLVMPGGHFFTTSQEPALLEALEDMLSAEERRAWA